MTAHLVAPTAAADPHVVLRYAVMPIDMSFGIAVETVTAMLDDGAGGGRARILEVGEPMPWGAAPVLVCDTTLYAVQMVEETLRRWGSMPRPWLVTVADAPVRPVQDARFVLRAVEGRLAGIARLPYLPVLRAVRGPQEALEHKDVQSAAKKLRRTIEGK